MTPPATTTTAAARAVGLTKVYGEGETAVTALDDVTVEFDRGHLTHPQSRDLDRRSRQ